LKVLLDSCVWAGARTVLAAAGHEVEWVGDWSADPGDAEVLAHAARSGSVVVTLDKDFGELAVVRGHRHSGIVRIVGHRAQDQGAACTAALARYGEELAAGALVTIEPLRVRIRAAGSGGE
jgi:predicted nuclease of predicted toxin-antitoxin system